MSKVKTRLVVLIPHYNSEPDLWTSLSSIREPFDVDVLVVDDGSKHKPDEESLRSKYRGGQLFLLSLSKNQGIEHALNHGLDWIRERDYDFVARLDCGDINMPDKYAKQIDFLDQNRDIMLLGTWVNVVDEQRQLLYVLKHPTDHEEIKNQMYLNSMFVHPTVVFRTQILESLPHYPVNFKAAEDYAYFFQIVRRYKTANLPELLLDYIVDPNSISSSKRRTQVWSRIRVIIAHFKLGWYPIYGLFRNIALLFMSRGLANKLKQQLNIGSEQV